MEFLSLSRRLTLSRVAVSFFVVILLLNPSLIAGWTGYVPRLNLRGDLGFACSSINANTPYTENFDTLANTGTGTTVPPGWLFSEALANMNTVYAASTGTSTAGDTYSFGPAANTDRAFGGLQTGTLLPTVGGCFVNATGAPINQLNITYDGEQWRLGATGRNDRLDFEYSLNATSLTTGTWTAVDSLDFAAPVSTGTTGVLDGNVNKVTVSNSISGLSLVNGATIYVRFLDFNAAGSDDGLGVDNFNLSALIPTAAQVSLSGHVTDSSGRGIRNAVMMLDGPGLVEVRYSATGSFGYYNFEGVPVGTYILTVSAKRHTFMIPTRIVTLNDNVTDADFVAEPQE